MTRAVIELSSDISPAMPHMSKLIAGCAYNPQANTMGFRVKDTSVIIEAHKITINNAKDEAEARKLVNWLKDIVNAADPG